MRDTPIVRTEPARRRAPRGRCGFDLLIGRSWQRLRSFLADYPANWPLAAYLLKN